jgi:nitronate monooxygenase
MTRWESLQLDLPIVQAPMAGVQDGALVVAVSTAGGLGSLPCAMLGLDGIRSELTRIASATSKPYNINFFCHKVPTPDAQRDQAWRTLLAPYYQELGIAPAPVGASASRVPFDDDMASIVEAFKPAVVSFHFGLPAEPLLRRVKASGAAILASATTVDEARWLEERGVDAIVAQGLEAGGHRGSFLSNELSVQLGTFALVPQIVRAVSVPIIAAGGIADARGVRAALELGAVAAQVGTAYLLCPETRTSAIHRAALTSDDVRHTAVTNLFTGRPARSIVNRVMRELGPLRQDVPEFPLALEGIAPLRARAEEQGRSDFSPLWSGQNASGCRNVPAGDLTRQLAE